MVEINAPLPVWKALSTIPPIAQAQTIPKIVQPSQPLNVVKQNGVYVPAINRKMDM